MAIANNDRIWGYRDPFTGEEVTGLTYEEAMELEKQEKEKLNDAKVGPQISAGIRAFESQGPMSGMASPGPGQAQAQPQTSQPAPMQNRASTAPNVSVSRFGEDGFMGMVDSAVQSQQSENKSSPFEGTPSFDSLSAGNNGGAMSAMQDSYPGFTPEQMAKEKQMSADYMALIEGIPRETVRALNARFRMGELSPTQFQKELIKANEDMRAFKNKKSEEEYKSKLKQDEDTNTQLFQNQRNIDNIESQEKMNREDNATALQVANINAATKRDTSGAGNEKDIFNREYKLRTQYNQLSKDFRTVKDAFEKIETSSKLKNASGDMALVYGFMRLQDPTSTVREGEYATAENARGVPESVMNIYNKTIKGTKLSDRQREEFTNTARSQFQIAQDNQIQLDTQYRDIAKMYNLDPDRVMGGTIQPGQTGSGSASGTGSTVTRKKYNPQTGKFEVVQ